MNNTIIEELSEASKIEAAYFPMDVAFLSERIGGNQDADQTAPANLFIKDIHFIGPERIVSTSSITLSIDPEKIL